MKVYTLKGKRIVVTTGKITSTTIEYVAKFGRTEVGRVTCTMGDANTCDMYHSPADGTYRHATLKDALEKLV